MARRTRGIIGACVGLLPLAAVIAFPPIARTPTRFAYEMAAKAAIKAVQAAESQYYSQYGQYASSLKELGPSGADCSTRAGGRREAAR